MDRRRFAKRLTVSLAGVAIPSGISSAKQKKPIVMTVKGPLDARKLGTTLMHELVMVDFIGADKVSKERYNADEVFKTALPFLKRAAQLGCQTFVDCTPAYIGRDAELLRRLSDASGLNIITTTGYYGAAQDKFIPAHAYRESEEELARRWTREFEKGIEGAGIKPGIIKIGVDRGPLSKIDRKLVRAAALTHLRTGLTIGSHTGDGVAAMEQLREIERIGVSASAFIWIHAQNEKDRTLHLEAAKRGCWVEFDGISSQSLALHRELVLHMMKTGYINRTLISMDAGWYHVGEPKGGNYRGYESLFLEFLPALREHLSEEQIKQLINANPQSALMIEVRAKRH